MFGRVLFGRLLGLGCFGSSVGSSAAGLESFAGRDNKNMRNRHAKQDLAKQTCQQRPAKTYMPEKTLPKRPTPAGSSFSNTEIQSDWPYLGAAVAGPTRQAPRSDWDGAVANIIRASTWRRATGKLRAHAAVLATTTYSQGRRAAAWNTYMVSSSHTLSTPRWLAAWKTVPYAPNLGRPGKGGPGKDRPFAGRSFSMVFSRSVFQV